MIILKFPTGVRVVVLTANFVAVDVTDKSQGVWYQDFPKRTSGSCAFQVCSDGSPAKATGSIWRRHCAPLPCRNSPHFLLLGLIPQFYDFRAARVALVPSVPGTGGNTPGTGGKPHKGRDLHKYGHMRVRAL
ncbi:unnamed protein product, partial [Ectocarpus sp. 12 AP-2014]